MRYVPKSKALKFNDPTKFNFASHTRYEATRRNGHRHIKFPKLAEQGLEILKEARGVLKEETNKKD